MPPEIKTDRARILDCVMEIIDSDGWEGVSARTIARRLGVSTQPIYREFGDMEQLRAAATERGFEIFAQHMQGEALDHAVSYVMFAVKNGNLFNFLFRTNRCEYDGLDDMSHKILDTGIIEKLEKITGLPRERVYRLHLYVWMAMHGLAILSADNNVKIGEEEIKGFCMDLTRALKAYYGGTREEN